jgi:hypothetical protein
MLLRQNLHLPLYSRVETFPSDEAHAKIGPSSCGAQEMEFTTIKIVSPAENLSKAIPDQT